MSAFKEEDHRELAKVLNGHANTNWVLTYDVADLIKSLYKARDVSEFPWSRTPPTCEGAPKRRAQADLSQRVDRAVEPGRRRTDVKVSVSRQTGPTGVSGYEPAAPRIAGRAPRSTDWPTPSGKDAAECASATGMTAFS